MIPDAYCRSCSVYIILCSQLQAPNSSLLIPNYNALEISRKFIQSVKIIHKMRIVYYWIDQI